MAGINTISWSGIAVTPPDFNLGGGSYQFMGVATVWGTATLSVIGPDGATLLPVTGAALSANGYVIFSIGKGQTCRLVLAGITAFSGAISQVPLSPAS